MKIGDKVKTKDGENEIIKIKESGKEVFVILKNRLQYHINDVELIKIKKKKIEKIGSAINISGVNIKAQSDLILDD